MIITFPHVGLNTPASATAQSIEWRLRPRIHSPAENYYSSVSLQHSVSKNNERTALLSYMLQMCTSLHDSVQSNTHSPPSDILPTPLP